MSTARRCHRPGQPGNDEHGTDFDKSANDEDLCDEVKETDSQAQR